MGNLIDSTKLRVVWSDRNGWGTLRSTFRVLGIIATGYLCLAIASAHRWDQLARAWDSALPIGVLLAFFLAVGDERPLRRVVLPVVGAAVVLPTVFVHVGNRHYVHDLLVVAQRLGGFAVVGLLLAVFLVEHPPGTKLQQKEATLRPKPVLVIMIVLLPAVADYSAPSSAILQVVLAEVAVIVGIVFATIWETRRLSTPRRSPGLLALSDAMTFEEDGDAAAAKAAYDRAIDAHESDSSSHAAFRLGEMLEAHQDTRGAESAYQRAVDSLHQEWASAAAVRLGDILEKRGDLDGAKASYQRAVDSEHHDWAPTAAVHLGLMLETSGDLDGAKAAYQRAVDLDATESRAMAAVSLARVLEKSGDLDEAQAAYQRAIDFQDIDWIPTATESMERIIRHQAGSQP